MPDLEVLGVVKRSSPATWQVTWVECAAESFEVAQAVLKRRGVDFSLPRLHRLIEALGQRALIACQDALKLKVRASAPDEAQTQDGSPYVTRYGLPRSDTTALCSCGLNRAGHTAP